ncbi:MAG TPA: hypothetical protein VJ647_01885 [Chitinophagaceae bacterium]|nr:hypothetical protein [Chitinophagaceae bacterium]
MDLNTFGVPNELKRLPSTIKEDGGIKSINISITLGSGETTNEGFNAFKRGLEYTGEQYKTFLQQSGVKNINVKVNAVRGKANNAGVSIQLSR